MPVDKQVLMRYQVLNKCFRNRYREYTIDDLVDACNEALYQAGKPSVSKRTIQNDINALEADYGILLNEKLKHCVRSAYLFSEEEIRYATRTQLNWTHLRSLMGIKDPLERQFYAQMCSAEHWDTRIPGTLRHYLCSQKQ